ncbi:TIGR02569 family protein [Actinophytocola sp.]|uniref:TIGR02569 family protein n=1 Tax=Actinophytocola sp. TaxID=1872138 RepID=UPI002D38497C|nr:TIGR02569 family protein [Actinophytocola sp.]HYQ64193.1 TIGR02569 family protein [Actinophytocola sp.]
MTASPPPQHVRASFGAKDSVPELVGAGTQWRCDDIGLRPVTNPAEASWVAQTLSELSVPDLRIGRSLRSSDGRYVVGGWVGFRYVSGTPEPRYDDVIAASLRLHKATADLPVPRFVATRADVFAMADRAAAGIEDAPLNPALGGRLFDVISGARKPLGLRPQVVHGDLFGNVLFDGGEPPGIIDLVAFNRPPEWAAAVMVVDALAWGGADDGLPNRWSHLPEWPQALLHALLFRLAVHALHPHSTEQSMRGLERAARLVTTV